MTAAREFEHEPSDDALVLERRHERDDEAVARAVRILLAEPRDRQEVDAA